jgi:hypothetical protein
VTSAVDENTAHGFGGRREEVRLPGEMIATGADQFEPGLMDQGRRLQRLAGDLLSHLRGRKLAKFLVNQWEQLLCGLSLALLDAIQDARDVAHERSVTEGFEM